MATVKGQRMPRSVVLLIIALLRFDAAAVAPWFVMGLGPVALLAGCAAPALPEQPLLPPRLLTINEAVDAAVNDLLIPLRRLPAFTQSAKPAPEKTTLPLAESEPLLSTRPVIAVDHAVDRTGRSSAALEGFDSALLHVARERIAQFDIVTVTPSNSSTAHYLLAGTLTPLDASRTSPRAFRIDLSLTDVKTGLVVAKSNVLFRAENVDLEPTASPVTP